METTTTQATQEQTVIPEAPLGGITPKDLNLSDAQFEQPGGREAALANTVDGWENNDPLLAFLNDSRHPNQETGIQPSAVEPFAVPQRVEAPKPEQQPQGVQTDPGQQTQQTATTAGQQSTQAQQGQQAQQQQGETIESLRAQLDQFKEVQTFMQTQDYKDALAVMQVFRQDPVAFYRQYVPNAYQEIQTQDMAVSLQPEDFIRTRADARRRLTFPNAFQPSHASRKYSQSRRLPSSPEISN